MLNHVSTWREDQECRHGSPGYSDYWFWFLLASWWPAAVIFPLHPTVYYSFPAWVPRWSKALVSILAAGTRLRSKTRRQFRAPLLKVRLRPFFWTRPGHLPT